MIGTIGYCSNPHIMCKFKKKYLIIHSINVTLLFRLKIFRFTCACLIKILLFCIEIRNVSNVF